MISYFKVRNFKSILDVNVSFDFKGKAPNNYKESENIYFLEVNKKNKISRFVPVMSFYGANSSGKSNIIDAFYVLNQILWYGIEENYFPNELNDKYNYSYFEIEFFIDLDKYSYYLEYDASCIREEKLLKNDEILYSINNKDKKNNFNNIIKDHYNKEKFNRIIDIECSQFENIQPPKYNKLQILPFLTRIKQNYPGLNKDLINAYEYLTSTITIKREISIQQGFDILYQVDEDKLDAYLKEITLLLKRLDISNIVRLEAKYNTQHGLILYPYYKDINGKEVKFNLRQESNGFHNLFSLICLFLDAFKKGKVLIIDELDRSLHSLILREIIKMFKNKNYNKTNSQLIFTCHNTDILNNEVFRVSEISIVNKTKKDGTFIKRFCDSDSIKNNMDFRDLYLSGKFWGIPFPYI